MFFIALFFIMVVMGSEFLNYYTPEATVAGVVVGSVGAYVYQSLVHWVLVPHMDTILGWRLVRYLGYQDTMCTDHTPKHIIVVENFDDTFGTGGGVVDKQAVRIFMAAQTF